MAFRNESDCVCTVQILFVILRHRYPLIMDGNPMYSGEYDLLCNENKEFLYETSERHVPPGLVLDDKPFTASSKYLTDETRTDSYNSPARVVPDQRTSTSNRKRKRNQAKDKLRTEAEQNAYKKLKQIIPSLRGCKRVTKLETIRQACLYIEKLQETLTGIRS